MTKKRRGRTFIGRKNRERYKDSILQNLAMTVVEIQNYLDDDKDCMELAELLMPKLEKLGKLELSDYEVADNVLDFNAFKRKREMFEPDL